MRQSLMTASLLVLLWLAWMLRDLVVVVAFAGLLAYALDPLVSWVERVRLFGGRSMHRGVAAGVVVVLLVLVAAATLVDAVPRLLQQLVRFAKTAPGALAHFEQDVRDLIQAHGGGELLAGRAGSDPVTSLLTSVERGATSLLGRAVGSLGGLASLVLLPLFTMYILVDRDRARASVLGLVPEHQLPRAARLMDALDHALRAYVRGQALVCAVMGAVMTIVLWLMGFPVALLLGVSAGLGETIPFVGFWIAALAIGLEGYSKSLGLAVAGLAAYAVADYLMGTFVIPRLLGRQVKLHPFIVNVSVIGGGMLLGPPGAILALPAAAMAKSVLDTFGPRAYRPDAAASGVTTTLS